VPQKQFKLIWSLQIQFKLIQSYNDPLLYQH
jgi:hypothetical protein